MVGEKLDLGTGLYTVPLITNILKSNGRKVRYIFDKYYRDKLKNSSNHNYLLEVENYNAVNFQGLIEIKIFLTLKDFGIDYNTTFLAHKFLSKELETPYPFAHHELLISGSDILFEPKNEDVIIKANSSKQTAIRGVILPFCKKIQYNANKVAESYYPLGKTRKVIVDPNHQFGEPTISGTNILVQSLAQMNKAGDSIEFLASLYNIDNESVKDAIEFYHQSVA